MSTTKATLIIIAFYIASIVSFVIIGVLANSLFDVFGGRGKSVLLYYSVWFVAAIFAGSIYYLMAYDYVSDNEFFKNNNWMLLIMAIVISILAIWLFSVNGQMQQGSARVNYYVPGNANMTYTFFITFILATIFARFATKPNFAKNKKN